jgi:hypothetical protein
MDGRIVADRESRQLPAGGPRRLALHVLALTLAVLGGGFGVIAALAQELLAGRGLTLSAAGVLDFEA